MATTSNQSNQSNQSGSDQPLPNISGSGGSRLIRRILTPAVRLWLQSQVEQADQLAIAIDSSDRQLLSGHIPQAQLAAASVVYQGLHFGIIDVTARTIRTNGLRILKGDTFRLLEPLPIDVTLTLTEANLNHSLQSPLFANAVNDLVQRIVAHSCDGFQLDGEPGDGWHPSPEAREGVRLDNPQISVTEDRLIICGALTGALTGVKWVNAAVMNRGDGSLLAALDQGSLPLRVDTGLALKDGRTLVFQDLQVRVAGVVWEGRSPATLEQFAIDLGDTTEMTVVTLADQQVTCQGRIVVMP